MIASATMEAAVGDKVEKRGEKRKRFSKEGLEILKSSYDKRGAVGLLWGGELGVVGRWFAEMGGNLVFGKVERGGQWEN